jgi:hypothetical protein
MSISQQNYEEWIVAFLDGELSDDELVLFHEFFAANPDLQSELDAYGTVKFEEEEVVVFEHKEKLYKKAGALVLLKKVWPLAAALVLAFAIWPFVNNNETEEVPAVAQEKKIEQTKKEQVVDVEEVEKEISEEPKQVAPEPVIAQQPKVQQVKQSTVPKPIIRKQQRNIPQEQMVVKKKYVTVPQNEVQEKEVEKTPEPKMLEKPLKEVILVQEKPKTTPEPKRILTPIIPEQEEQESALFVLSEETHPRIYEKLNSAVSKVENKINTIKKIKEEPITVCIGKLKLFTINTARAAQAN